MRPLQKTSVLRIYEEYDSFPLEDFISFHSSVIGTIFGKELHG